MATSVTEPAAFARESPRPRVGSPPRRRLDSRPLLLAPATLFVLFIMTPVAALVWRAAEAPGFWPSIQGHFVVEALSLTAATTSCTLVLAVVDGTPLAYLLARTSFRGKRLVETVIDFPLLLPPVVAGVALLMAFGRRGVLGPELGFLGLSIPFTSPAVVLAQLFVAGPFYVRSARVGFGAVDRAVEEAAATDGASGWDSFRRITLPLALPGIATGAVLCFGRSVSEFGATLLFAGNLEGRTQTMSLAIMQAMQSNLSAALALAVLLVVMAGTVLFLSRTLAIDRLQG
jgi:molybdate transport system permease protein